MSYKLAIFDFDGTLADSIDWFIGVINQVAERHGFRRIEPHEIESLRGYEARQMIQHLNVPMWKMPLVARNMRARMTREIGGIALFPGVDAMLERLAERGVQLAVVTSNSAENVRRVLGPRNSALIRHWGCGAAVLGKGPKLRKVVRAAGVSPAEAISIGDEIRDLRASRAERIPFGAVTWGFTRGDALRALQPDLVFETMEEISGIVADGVVRPTTMQTPGG